MDADLFRKASEIDAGIKACDRVLEWAKVALQGRKSLAESFWGGAQPSEAEAAVAALIAPEMESHIRNVVRILEDERRKLQRLFDAL